MHRYRRRKVDEYDRFLRLMADRRSCRDDTDGRLYAAASWGEPEWVDAGKVHLRGYGAA